MDRRLRELEILAAQGGITEKVQYLAAQARAGVVPEVNIQARAIFGDPVAQLLTGLDGSDKLMEVAQPSIDLFNILTRWLALILRANIHNEIREYEGGDDGWHDCLAAYRALLTTLRMIRGGDALQEAIDEGVAVRRTLFDGFSNPPRRIRQPAIIVKSLDAVLLLALENACQAAIESGIILFARENVQVPLPGRRATPKISLDPIQYQGGDLREPDYRITVGVLLQCYIHTRLLHPKAFDAVSVESLYSYGSNAKDYCLIDQFLSPEEAIHGLTQVALRFEDELANPIYREILLDYLENDQDWIPEELAIGHKILELNRRMYGREIGAVEAMAAIKELAAY